MLVFKQGSPEMQLLDLFQLVKMSSCVYVDGAGASELESALRVAREALAERIRAVSAEVAKTPAAPPAPTFAPADVSTLKVGDEVWVRGVVCDIDNAGGVKLPIEVQSGEDVTHWPVPTSIFRRSA